MHMLNRIFLTALFLVFSAHFADSESIKIGGSKTASGGAAYIAIEKGYFKAEGLNVQVVFFDSAQPIAVAVVSGDIDVGTTGLSAGFYNLGGQGALKIIGAQGHESPGFHTIGYFVSRRAYEGGLNRCAISPAALSASGSSARPAITSWAPRPRNTASTSRRFMSSRCSRTTM